MKTVGDWTTASRGWNTVGHAAVGCASSVMNHNSCGGGALAGGFSAAWGNYGPGYAAGKTLDVIVSNTLQSATIGGISSMLGGGKFWNGAVTGAYGYLFNELAHQTTPAQRGHEATFYAKEGIVCDTTCWSGGAVENVCPECYLFGLTSSVKGLFSLVDYAAAQTFSAIGSTGRLGEMVLGTLGGEGQVFLRTSLGGRFVDRLVAGVAYESKVGLTELTTTSFVQAAKDVLLMRSQQVLSVEWHFFRSPVTGLAGPSASLANVLQAAGIKVVIH
jgi:hypothetical protein